MFVLGGVPLGIYFHPLDLHQFTASQGFDILASTRVHITRIFVTLMTTTSPPLLWLSVFWDQKPTIPFNLMMDLPLHLIEQHTEPPFSTVPPSKWNITYDGPVSSIISTAIENDTGAIYNLAFTVEKTYLTSKRGIEMITLLFQNPVGGTPPFETLRKELQVSPLNFDRMEVFVVLPISVRDVQAFPETSSRTSYPPIQGWTNYSYDTIEWDFTQRRTVVLSFVDEDVASPYEFCLIFGSILFSAGVSAGLDYWRKK
jgi:hypothetical protein